VLQANFHQLKLNAIAAVSKDKGLVLEQDYFIQGVFFLQIFELMDKFYGKYAVVLDNYTFYTSNLVK